MNLSFITQAKASAAGILAAISIFTASGNAQKADDATSLSVFRQNVGIFSADARRTATHLFKDTDIDPVSGDFDGDGRLDTGTFDRSARLWTIRLSGDTSTLAISFPLLKQQRAAERPVVAPADFDGDGRADLAVWCAGSWQIMSSSIGSTAEVIEFGIKGDVPVPADFDGDGKADLAVFRPAENRWYIRGSETGVVNTIDFGTAGTDILLPADYTGDGKADIAVYRNGIWNLIDSETGALETFEFGFEDARPVPGDFNRDGATDFAVFRKGTWYVYDGSRLVSYKFGADDDVPLSNVPVRQSMPGN